MCGVSACLCFCFVCVFVLHVLVFGRSVLATGKAQERSPEFMSLDP